MFFFVASLIMSKQILLSYYILACEVYYDIYTSQDKIYMT